MGDGFLSTARVICDVYTPEGVPFEGDPRIRAQCELKCVLPHMGLDYQVVPELEFFLFKRR